MGDNHKYPNSIDSLLEMRQSDLVERVQQFLCAYCENDSLEPKVILRRLGRKQIEGYLYGPPSRITAAGSGLSGFYVTCRDYGPIQWPEAVAGMLIVILSVEMNLMGYGAGDADFEEICFCLPMIIDTIGSRLVAEMACRYFGIE